MILLEYFLNIPNTQQRHRRNQTIPATYAGGPSDGLQYGTGFKPGPYDDRRATSTLVALFAGLGFPQSNQTVIRFNVPPNQTFSRYADTVCSRPSLDDDLNRVPPLSWYIRHSTSPEAQGGPSAHSFVGGACANLI